MADNENTAPLPTDTGQTGRGDEIAWVAEVSPNGHYPPTYYVSGAFRDQSYSTDPNLAMRFSRCADVETAIKTLRMIGCVPREHSWPAATIPVPAHEEGAQYECVCAKCNRSFFSPTKHAIICPNCKALTPPASEPEFGWVIERGKSLVCEPEYWSGNGWSKDNLLAIRFSRKEDAERTASGWDEDEYLPGDLPHRIAEHGWG